MKFLVASSMEKQKTSQDYIQYLEPSFIARLDNLELKARAIVEGFMVGLHKSPYHGFSVEFSEHRPYQQGDPIRDIDWKIFGKRDKYFIKKFEEETNLACRIIIDSSNSMSYRGKGIVSKLEYSKTLAAALLYLMVKQQDAVGLCNYSDKPLQSTEPKSSPTHLRYLIKLLAEIKPGGKTGTAESLKFFAEKIRKRGLVILISDFFDDPEKIIPAIKQFKFRKNEIIVFQILDPLEADFAFEEETVFIDSETGKKIGTHPLQLKRAYQESVKDFLSKIKSECNNSGIDYNLILTNTTYDRAILNYFKKRKILN